MKIRRAKVSDAQAASVVLRRSISELCVRDHENDPAMLESWFANKTPEKFKAWAKDELCFVATDDGGIILGVGLLSKTGEIKLNYVSPDVRFQGISSALIQTMERQALRLGVDRLTLNSTATAHRFYLARGYRDEGPPQTGRFKDAVYPMVKELKHSADRK